MRILSYPLSEYLALTNNALFELRAQETACVISEMQGARLRLFTFVAPTDHCWGMDLSASKACTSWFDQLSQQGDLIQSVKRDIKANRRKLSEIALGLLPIGSDAEGNDLSYGRDDNGLHTFWFRSFAFPMDSFTSEEFFSLWKAHEQQLGKFFLLPYADSRVRAEGVGGCEPASWDADVLCKLFWDRRELGEAGVNEQVKLLGEYQDEAKARELDALLNPEFLLQEHVRWSISLVPPVSALQKLAVDVYRQTLGKNGVETFDVKTKVAILRLRIARTLRWPLGVRLLAQQVEAYAGQTSKPVLVTETELYIGRALENYPVLAK
jgi:hypothetical protein